MARAPKDEDGSDNVLTELRRAPYRLRRPLALETPFVFASPHSGRAYPRSFVAQSRLSFNALRRSEDAFIEELFLPVVDCGSPLIAAAFPTGLSRREPRAGRIRCGHVRRPAALCRRRGEPSRQRRAGRYSPHRARRCGDLSPETRRRRSERPARGLLPALSRSARTTCRRSESAVRIGDRHRLPFHAVGRCRAGHRARRSLRRFRIARSHPCGRRRIRGARLQRGAQRPLCGRIYDATAWAARPRQSCAADRNQSRALHGRRRDPAGGVVRSASRHDWLRACARCWRSIPRC